MSNEDREFVPWQGGQGRTAVEIENSGLWLTFMLVFLAGVGVGIILGVLL